MRSNKQRTLRNRKNRQSKRVLRNRTIRQRGGLSMYSSPMRDITIKTLEEIPIPESDRDDSILHTITSALLNDRDELSIFLQRFPYMTRLSVLTIFNVGFSDDDVAALAEALPRPLNALVILDLSESQIGDQGAIILANMLSNMTKLTQLDLYDNKIRSVGAKALAEKKGRVKINGIRVPKPLKYADDDE